MKKWFVASIILIVFLTYGLIVSQWNLIILPQALTGQNPPDFFDYEGVMNVHSSLSSGSKSPNEIIAIAQEEDLDFLFFTDLPKANPSRSIEGYHGNLLVFSDGVYNYLNSKVLNYLSNDPESLSTPAQSQIYLADLLTQNQKSNDLGLFVIAHPLKKNFMWNGPIPVGIDGIEIVNLKSIWQNQWFEHRLSFLWTLFLYPFNSRLALIRLFETPTKEFELWDKLQKEKPIIGFSGSDADSKIKITDSFHIEFPSYETLFALVRTHVLLASEFTGNTKSDQNKLSDAIRNGNFYLSLDSLASPKGFISYIQKSKKNKFLMGSKVFFSDDLSLHVSLPQKPHVPFDVIIYKNGEQLMVSNSLDTTMNINSPGTYRVVVRVIPTLPLPDGKKWIPWIFTNPFYVLEK